jgi:NAD(P)-dependent dehydrogenase (short-subunit alcohol dehydrogenase family)
MGRVDGKVALVTGGASGIGRGCVEALAREGARVVIADIQDQLGKEVAAEVNDASYMHLDVTSESEWAAVCEGIDRKFERLDILVNNAGIGVACQSITTMPLADFKRQQAVNVEGVFLGMKHALPVMRKAGHGGSIINMSSVAGLKGSPILAGYCATKGAVRLLTKAVALECANFKDGVRINSVHPGIIETPIWLGIAGTMSPGSNVPIDLDERAAAFVPLGVKGYPADIANAVLWLASEESRYVTGAELVVDGGLSVR